MSDENQIDIPITKEGTIFSFDQNNSTLGDSADFKDLQLNQQETFFREDYKNLFHKKIQKMF